MKYDYRVEDKGDYALVILPEKVMIPHSFNFKPAMQKAYELGYNTIVLDCTDLQMFDTAGFAYVVAFQEKMKDRGGEIKMINVGNDYVKEMFRTIEMSKFFSIEEV